MKRILIALLLAACSHKPKTGPVTPINRLCESDCATSDLTKSTVTFDRTSGVVANNVDAATATIVLLDTSAKPIAGAQLTGQWQRRHCFRGSADRCKGHDENVAHEHHR